MGAHARLRAKKSKKEKEKAKLFDKIPNEHIRELLLDEFFTNVCRKYAKV
jgi:hypothetical protein